MKNTVRIYDRNFAETGFTASPVELFRLDEFRGAGKATLKLRADDPAAAMLVPDGYIGCGGEHYVILSVETDHKTGTVTANCAGLLYFLSETVLPEEYTIQGQAASIVCELAGKCRGNVPKGLAIGSAPASEVVKFTSGRSLVLEDSVSLCHLGGIGMAMHFDGSSFVFEAKLPRDRTRTAADPYFVSGKIGTVGAEAMEWDLSGYRNVAVISGAEKEEGGRYLQVVRSENLAIGGVFPHSDYRTREVLVNFTSPQRPYMKEGADGKLVLDEAEYLAAMRASGAAVLGRCMPKLKLYGTTVSEDLMLGDMVTVTDSDTGISGTALVTAREYGNRSSGADSIFGEVIPKITYTVEQYAIGQTAIDS